MKRIARDCVVLALILSTFLVAGAVGVYFEIQSRHAVAGTK